MVDHLDRDPHALIEAGSALHRLVDGVAVHQQEEVVALVGREEHAARTDLGGAERVGGDGSERQEVDRFGDRVEAVAPDVLRREGARRRGCGGARLGGFGGGGDDALIEEALQVAGVRLRERGRRREARAEQQGRGRQERAAPHPYTFAILRISAMKATCCLRACVRLTSSLGLPLMTSKPRTTPWGT